MRGATPVHVTVRVEPPPPTRLDTKSSVTSQSTVIWIAVLLVVGSVAAATILGLATGDFSVLKGIATAGPKEGQPVAMDYFRAITDQRRFRVKR
jgi:hypothetical protein